MKKIIFSSILMFVALFFLIVKLSSQSTGAAQLPVSNSLSTTKNTATTNTTMMNQKQSPSGYTTARPKAGAMTRTS